MSSRWTNIAIGVLALAVGALTVQNWRLSAEIAGLRDRTLPHDVKRLMG